MLLYYFTCIVNSLTIINLINFNDKNDYNNDISDWQLISLKI